MSSELSSELRAVLKRLVAEPLMDTAQLRGQVEAHMVRADAEFEGRVFSDAALAKRLGKGCLAMLAIEGLDDNARHLVQAAAKYYVEDDDEDGDFSSMIGFEDDAMVFNHVAGEIGRPELTVKIE